MKLDLLLMRAILLNAGGLALVWVGIDKGAVQNILSMDQTYISESILVVFAFGWLLCMFRIWECSRALNRAKRETLTGFPTAYDEFHVYCSQRRNPIDVTAKLLPMGGLAGTVYGFLMAMSEMDVVNLTSSAMAGQEVGHVINYMGVALVTTLAGVITKIYLTMNQRMLEGGYERLYQEM